MQVLACKLLFILSTRKDMVITMAVQVKLLCSSTYSSIFSSTQAT